MEEDKRPSTIEEVVEFGINATDGDDPYSAGMRNGMRWVLSCVNGETPSFEECPPYKYDPTKGSEKEETKC